MVGSVRASLSFRALARGFGAVGAIPVNLLRAGESPKPPLS